MNRINEFGLEPGVYRHYKGGLYVVTDVVTHMEAVDVTQDALNMGPMAELPDPLVIYRDVEPIKRHVNGKSTIAHQVYARKLSDFNGAAPTGEQRFIKA